MFELYLSERNAKCIYFPIIHHRFPPYSIFRKNNNTRVEASAMTFHFDERI